MVSSVTGSVAGMEKSTSWKLTLLRMTEESAVVADGRRQEVPHHATVMILIVHPSAAGQRNRAEDTDRRPSSILTSTGIAYAAANAIVPTEAKAVNATALPRSMSPRSIWMTVSRANAATGV